MRWLAWPRGATDDGPEGKRVTERFCLLSFGLCLEMMGEGDEEDQLRPAARLECDTTAEDPTGQSGFDIRRDRDGRGTPGEDVSDEFTLFARCVVIEGQQIEQEDLSEQLDCVARGGDKLLIKLVEEAGRSHIGLIDIVALERFQVLPRPNRAARGEHRASTV
ncbi:hypothetical protein SIM91_02870 [Rhodococcus opacus]|uniref:hypothetical protein n=1 Tax=Rhodococcus opacus TaxID=37919 RepID=UPI001FF9B0AB|nr:hypothetical protein [Rhodococcus opacus]MDX5962285.1 hypothetical protein [Rhodococcus opacus]